VAVVRKRSIGVVPADVVRVSNGDGYTMWYRFGTPRGARDGRLETAFDAIHAAWSGDDAVLDYLAALKEPGAIRVHYWQRFPRCHWAVVAPFERLDRSDAPAALS
jgi:hypothetical protein